MSISFFIAIIKEKVSAISNEWYHGHEWIVEFNESYYAETLLMHEQALALSKTMRMPLVLILSKRRMRFLLGHSRIPLRHLHILMTEHLADGLHRHTCLQSNEAGERVSSRMVEIVKSVLFSTSTSKAFWMESNKCSMSLLVSTASLLLFSFGCFSALC